ncbi:hypothetical protein [Micromonospora aurantiaca (nom. illeg.)]|uniref:hypothetical protein n=1 Tax=Micromonospora aurantiaca (nom. illeg.) TaxID=47850 RepID=UPI0033ED1A39
MKARMVNALDSRLAFRLVQFFAALALVLSVYVGVQQVRLTQCLAAYNEASNKASAARTLAAEQDRAAQDELFRQIAEQPRNGIDALREYNDQRAQADEQRRRNPLPAPPSQRCG